MNHHRDTVYVAPSKIHGKGLFAIRPIEKGEYIGTYEGPIAKKNGSLVLWITEEDGTTYGISGRNTIRYANHSRRPNADFEGPDLYATKRIKQDGEITIDYGEDWADIG